MRALIQRVSEASVTIDGEEAVKGRIDAGLLILLGIERADTHEDVEWLIKKVTQLRVFGDADGKMNLSLIDIDGDALVVSQFTLHARTRKGTRPSFDRAAPPAQAIPLYDMFIRDLEAVLGRPVASGEFGAMMRVDLCNDGPVTLMLDSKLRE